MMSELYIGLMSGTSIDGIDAALVDLSGETPLIVATHYTPYPEALRTKVLALCHKGEDEIERLGELDIILGKAFAEATNQLLQQKSLSPHEIKAIGSHGQTIRHCPHHPHRFTMQIGDPNTIAVETGITTVADFRRKDIALGGQGAPLVPAFHQHVFRSQETHRAIVNIGGIANVTLLHNENKDAVIGFDTGPGNVLMDAWIALHKKARHDEGGAWAAQGTVNADLLKLFLSDPYFEQAPPKSTGREYFSLLWLQKQLSEFGKAIAPGDVQATLVDLTAQSILSSIQKHLDKGDILICGGGAHNHLLMSRLQDLSNARYRTASTQKFGIDPDWVEAVAFAWLAQQTLNRQPGNLPSVTGAKQAVILGGIYYGL